MACIIVVEGHDRAGKASQTKRLVQTLLDAGHRAVRVEVPVLGPFHSTIYRMLKNGQAKRFPNVFQLVQFINKLSFQLFKLPGQLRDNDFVIFDRWALSGLIYGEATGVNRFLNRVLYSLLRKPDITLILTGPSYRRITRASDDYEEDDKLQSFVKRRYLEVGSLGSADGFRLVSNEGTQDEVHQSIVHTLVHHAGLFNVTFLGGSR